MSKKNPNGKVVLFTPTGVKIVTADIHASGGTIFDNIKPWKNNIRGASLNVEKGEKYIVVGMTKTIGDPDNPRASVPMPFIIDEAVKYASTKFFRFMIDAMKLAQFDPFDNWHGFDTERFYCLKTPREPEETDIDYSVSVAEIDAQLYRKYGFPAALIDFIERRYEYDDGAGNLEGERAGVRGSVHTGDDDVQDDVAAGSADTLTNLDQPLLDPTCGQGQFPTTQLVLRLAYNVGQLDAKLALRALYSIYGIDIQAESIAECRAHMLATLKAAYEFFAGEPLDEMHELFAKAIIEKHFIVGDSLKMLAGQPSLF